MYIPVSLARDFLRRHLSVKGLLLCSWLPVAFTGCDTAKPAGDTDGLTDGDRNTDPDLDGDGFPASSDCNDDQAAINPAAAEICDGIDNNCDGDVDEEVTDIFWLDADGDGYGDPAVYTEACTPPAGHVPNSNDCDDGAFERNPGTAELCDGVDNNCDGDVDEGLYSTWMPDDDGDGFGDANAAFEGCDPGDGHTQLDGDCDDTDEAVNPEATESCNEVDDDCDGSVDEGVTTTFYADGDTDGYGRLDSTTEACFEPAGYAALAGDCDDTLFAINPGASETCNELDDNCDGVVDENTAIDALTWYADTDTDDYGDADSPTRACAQPSGYVGDDTDCDDTDADTHPDADEYCDGHDDNCDGDIDEDTAVDAPTWYRDADGDSYGNATVSAAACSAPSGYVVRSTDCDDTSSAVNPGATEVCNEVDDDCDSLIDDNDSTVSGTTTFYADTDTDSYGDPASTSQACDQPTGTVTNADDCDDSLTAVNPAATEVCNGYDDDCDGDIDDDDSSITGQDTWYIDYDGDSYGSDSFTTEACSQPSGYTDNDNDCDDTDGTIFPSAPEQCDGDDDDCDGDIDEGVAGVSAACAADSCAEILDLGASTGDGLYYLDPDGTASLWECDMTTDGGGWTLVADWNRVDDGDNISDFNSEFTVNYNNMGTFQTTSNALFWQDVNSSGGASADVLSIQKDIPFSNDGEVLYDVEYLGESMEQSGAWLWVESGGTEYNLECWEYITTTTAYLASELAYAPSYSCGNSTSPKTFEWDGFTQDSVGADIDTLLFTSLMYDSCCDYSYLYKFEFWVR